MKKIKYRKSWIDICRGVGILLVLYGHVLGSDQSRYFIYSFHMPLFFFLSGLVFNTRDAESYKIFIKKNLKQIILPYYVFAGITLLLWLLFIQPSASNHISQEIWGIIYGNGIFPSLEFNSPLWFLPCLFITKFFYMLMHKYLRSVHQKYISLVVFGTVGYVLSAFFPLIKLPFSIEVAFTAVVFFGFGHLLLQLTLLKATIKANTWLAAIIMSVLACVLAWVHFRMSGLQIDMRINQLNNIFLFYSAAFSGIFAVISISYIVKKNRFIEYIGKNTLLLFIWHYPLYLVITSFLSSFPITQNALLKNFFPTLYTIVAVLLILSCHILITKFKTSYAILNKN